MTREKLPKGPETPTSWMHVVADRSNHKALERAHGGTVPDSRTASPYRLLFCVRTAAPLILDSLN